MIIVSVYLYIFTRLANRCPLFQSFTQMFIKFLENESNPHQAARLPMETMINEARQKTQHRRTLGSPGGCNPPHHIWNIRCLKLCKLIHLSSSIFSKLLLILRFFCCPYSSGHYRFRANCSHGRREI